MLLKNDISFGQSIFGIDEAGRGPLAGPVVSACAYWKDTSELLPINDSKKLTPKKREKIYAELLSMRNKKVFWGVGIASASEIDEINILEATKASMRRAYKSCLKASGIAPDKVLIDGNQPISESPKVVTIVEGDQKSYAIATASIIAKVFRDQIMDKLHILYPHYAWEKNKGYGTKLHMEGMQAEGITPYHRMSFAPVLKCSKDIA